MKKKIISIILILFCLTTMLPNFVFATTAPIDPEEFTKIYDQSSGVSKMQNAGGQIYRIVRYIGIAVGIICLIILGAKYMLSSINDKAQIKEQLIPYAIGAVIMFGASALLTIIANFAQNLA